MRHKVDIRENLAFSSFVALQTLQAFPRSVLLVQMVGETLIEISTTF